MTGANLPAQVWPEKHPSAKLDYMVDYERACAREWSAWTDYAQDIRIRVFTLGRASGYQFRATTGGRSAGRAPQWRESGTINDGSVVWTPEAISTQSLLRTLSGTPTWTGPSGVTISDVAVSGFRATANIAGGIDGQDYAITIIGIGSDGLEIPEVAILPVRIPVRV